MKRQIAITILGLASLGSAGTASAQSSLNTYNVTLDGVYHSGSPMGGVDYLTASDLTGFTADFSSSKLLTFNFLAPAGQQFVYTPAGSSPTMMSVSFNVGNGQYTWGSVLSAGFLGDNGQGSTDVVGANFGTPPGGVGLALNDFLSSGFSFSGFTVTVEAPAGNSDQFANVPVEVLNFGFQSEAFGDPGQQVSLQPAPTPEPSTMALAGLGGLSLLLYRRRR